MNRAGSSERLLAYASASLALVAAAGCGATAYKITPVPVDRSLEETVVIEEGGFLPPKVVLIDVEGALMNQQKPSWFGEGEHPVSLFVEKLDKAADDPGVCAVILRIDSPGGSVTASDLMHAELLRFKERTKGKRPVVAVLMGVAASGAYYLACGTDEIIAHPTTVTGSIGVLMQMVNVAGTMAKIGVEAESITSGKMKAAGSPFQKLKPEEREVFQKLVDQFYDRFVKVVATGRPGLDEAKVRKIADGRVYSAQQALQLGLVDRIGTLRDAVAGIKSKINAKRVRVITYQRPLGWKPNIYAEAPGGQPQINMINIDLPKVWPECTPQFLYLWAPGL